MGRLKLTRFDYAVLVTLSDTSSRVCSKLLFFTNFLATSVTNIDVTTRVL